MKLPESFATPAPGPAPAPAERTIKESDLTILEREQMAHIATMKRYVTLVSENARARQEIANLTAALTSFEEQALHNRISARLDNG